QTSANVLNSGYTPDVFAVIQSNWREIGVDLQINLVDSPSWQATIQTGESPMTILLSTRMEPDQLLSQFLYGPNCAPNGANFSCYTAVDDLILAQKTELDPQRRAEILKELQARFAEDVPHIVLFSV